MAAIWNDIVIPWEDEQVTVTPTLNFINKIEQKQGSSLTHLLSRMQSGDLPTAISCHVIGTTLREGGISITDEDIYSRVLELGATVGVLVGTIIAGCLPMPKGVKPDVEKPVVP